MQIPTARLLLIGLGAIVLASFLPLWASGYILGLLTIAYYFGVFAMAWDLLFGFAGEVNFGPTFLIGVGAYTAGILDNLYQPPIWLCIAAGTAAAITGGLVLALPALRLRGPYFGLTTLVAVLILQNFIVVDAHLTGGEIGLTVPDVISISDATNYLIALWFMAISGAILFSLSRSPVGLILQASGQDAVQAGALGFNVTKHKLTAFVISAFFSGLAGTLMVFYLGSASVGTFIDITVGVQIIISAVLGGRRTILGAVLGRYLSHRHERGAAAARRSVELHRVRHGADRGAVIPEWLFRPAHPHERRRVSATELAHLEVTGLTKRFGGLVAVKEMSLSVAAGKILGLIGPNGSGKSTVMKLIMGIERPDGGSVRISGVEVCGWPSHRIARMGAGIVFQHSRPLHRQTVLENIKLALLPDKLTRLFADPQTDARARAIAARVGLTAVLDRRPGTLPFADLRKIEIAKAIARDPQVLLIDEPFAGLTAKETAAFSDLICELRDDGRAVLLVDHNVKSVSRLVDRVIAMYVGERIAEGSADEVMRNETVRRVYLGGTIETAARPESSFRDAATPFLEVDKVSVHYGKAQALEQVSIHVHEREFVAVVGLNGAGKTTLFNTISGLLPYAGDMRRQGATLRGQSAAAIARGGIVQCPEGRELFVDMSVRENLDLGGQHLPSAESASPDRVAVRAVSRSCASGSGRRPARCPAASSKCSPSRAR